MSKTRNEFSPKLKDYLFDKESREVALIKDDICYYFIKIEIDVVVDFLYFSQGFEKNRQAEGNGKPLPLWEDLKFGGVINYKQREIYDVDSIIQKNCNVESRKTREVAKKVTTEIKKRVMQEVTTQWEVDVSEIPEARYKEYHERDLHNVVKRMFLRDEEAELQIGTEIERKSPEIIKILTNKEEFVEGQVSAILVEEKEKLKEWLWRYKAQKEPLNQLRTTKGRHQLEKKLLSAIKPGMKRLRLVLEKNGQEAEISYNEPGRLYFWNDEISMYNVTWSDEEKARELLGRDVVMIENVKAAKYGATTIYERDEENYLACQQ